MFKCDKCNAELEENAKFCISCGEKVPMDSVDSTIDKDISWYFLIFSFLIGIPEGINNVKNSYEATADLSILEYLNAISKTSSIPGEFFAEIIGGSLAPLLFSSIIIGFIWGIKLLMSKSYKKPIQHIFIMSIIFHVLLMLAD